MVQYITLGPEGSNCHIATIEYIKLVGASPEILLEEPFFNVIRNVSKSNGKYSGIVAIENAEGGLVQGTAKALNTFRPKINGLPRVIEGIQDSKNNVTRFLSISNRDCEEVTGKDKTTLRFEVKNDCGSLNKVLEAFADEKINLSMIHSIPTGDIGRYYMIIDAEAHRKEDRMVNTLASIESNIVSESLFVYGSYPRTVNLQKH